MRAKRARPAGPAESSVFHNSARRGPTKEAHRRALNQPDGLLRSEAGRGHAPKPRVTPPRERPDQAKRREAGSYRYAVACVPIMVGIAVPIMVGIMVMIVVSDRVTEWHSRNCSLGATGWPELPLAIADDSEVRGPKSASARPGPCTRPRSADALTRREIPSGPTGAQGQDIRLVDCPGHAARLGSLPRASTGWLGDILPP